MNHHQLASAVFKSNAVGALAASLIQGDEEHSVPFHGNDSFDTRNESLRSPFSGGGEAGDARRKAEEGFVSDCSVGPRARAPYLIVNRSMLILRCIPLAFSLFIERITSTALTCASPFSLHFARACASDSGAFVF